MECPAYSIRLLQSVTRRCYDVLHRLPQNSYSFPLGTFKTQIVLLDSGFFHTPARSLVTMEPAIETNQSINQSIQQIFSGFMYKDPLGPLLTNQRYTHISGAGSWPVILQLVVLLMGVRELLKKTHACSRLRI